MVNNQKGQLVFNTAIITYPSDYDGLLSLGIIVDNFEKIINKSTKVVVAREDPDDQIRRIHYHCYFDSVRRKSVSTKYFDIKLPEPVYVVVYEDTTRKYYLKQELDSKLGIDNDQEMHAKLDQWMEGENKLILNKDNTPKIIKWDVLYTAHPNIELKKQYGDKYCMLRYVMKQKLVARSNFDVEKELERLEKEREQLLEKARELTNQELLKELNVQSIDELIDLCKKYVKKLKNQKRRKLNKDSQSGKSNKRGKSNSMDDPNEWEFTQKIREILIGNVGITKNEVLAIIKENEDYWHIYTKKYINYSKLINDLFKNKPNAKPKPDYNRKFYLPRKLYDYCCWLDKWVENWMTGKTELLEHRPLGLVLIGASRTCKTSLMVLFGPFSYFKNVWNIDNWEGLPPYTIMDDMDAGDEGKGLSFCWYKPFFGAQDCMTVTDKYRPKEDIVNGKPLIWINNYPIDETFKSEYAQDYIRKNMIIVDIGDKPLCEKTPDWIEGHNDYVEFDPKDTWYYKNVVCKKDKKVVNYIEMKCKDCGEIDYVDEENKENWECLTCKNKIDKLAKEAAEALNNYTSIKGQLERLREEQEDLEPLIERKRKLNGVAEFEQEKGRPITRIRTEN